MFVLDEEQTKAAEIEPDVRQVVMAPAGSGKTETVAALAEHLVAHGVDSAQEVLVLSFSRAAVSAVRRRFAAKELRGVSVRTLDGLAARVLQSAVDDGGSIADFDGRIRQATKLLDRGQVPDELDAVSHIVVDEIQDVVGDRAKFVLAILRAVREHAGFTLLGDPQQAIYNFQLDGPADVTSPAFLRMIDSAYAPRLVGLQGEYRALDDDARRVTRLSHQLASASGKPRIDLVRSAVAEVLILNDLHDLADLIDGWDGTTAVLCVNNGIAMTVHEALRSDGVAASLQASAEQRGVVPWVADQVPDSTLKVSRADFEEGWDAYAVGMSSADAWRLLKRAERNFKSPALLDVPRLSTAVALRDVPAELIEAPSSTVTVSTVHRSKGLEFDNVVLINPRSWLPASCNDDAASVAYVALSRARRKLFAVNIEVDKRMRKDAATDRWYRGGPKPWHTFGFELQPTDTRIGEDPARDFDVQDHLAEASEGDVIELRRDALSTAQLPTYQVVHEGIVVGRTTERFGHLLIRRCKTGVPDRLSDLRISAFETRGCGPELQSPKVATLWRAPVVSGMSTIEW